MNNPQLDAITQQIADSVTSHLVSKLKATSISLNAESKLENKRFTKALQTGQTTGAKAEVLLVLADLARELVVHGYRGEELTDESIEGAMTALHIMSEDAGDLRSKMMVALRGWQVTD